MKNSQTIYVSWGGEIYGPSSWEEVVAGIRTSWFEKGTLYWHEGLEEWKPLDEFPVSAESTAGESWQRVKPAELPSAPSLPVTRGSNQRPRSNRSRAAKPRSRKLGGQGRALALGFALFAVLLTVGILLLLMLV